MGAQTPEGKIKSKLAGMLRRLAVWYFFPAANGMGRAGIPYVICVVNGLFVGIECKAAPDRKPTALQLQVAERITEAGGMWFLANSLETIDNIETWIKEQQRADRGTGQGAGPQAQQP